MNLVNRLRRFPRVIREIVFALSCCGAFLLLYVPSSQYPIRNVDTNAADSAQYHFIALNLLQGKGYHSRPIGPIEAYGETSRIFLQRPIQTPLEDQFKVASQRGPGYPLFLAAVYAIHGPRPDVAIRYQGVLAGLIGVLLVLIARQLWGDLASLGGVVAALLLRHEPEMTYTASALMSECLAAFLLTLSFFCATWAKRGAAWREILTGLLMAAAVLTRQALLLTAVIYGVCLLFPLRTSWRRAVFYALPCAIAFSAWTLFLSVENRGAVVMGSTGFSSVLNGLDPIACARANAVTPPSIDENSLRTYWGGVPIATPPSLSREVLRRLPSRIPEVLRLVRFKLKIGFYWIPQTLIWCIVIGTALASSSRAVVRPRLAMALAWTAALTLWFFVMSYSHPLLQAACLLLLPAALIARKVDVSRIWITAWLLGYLGMTVLTIAVQRYVRPYLPILFLLAVAAMPLFLRFVSQVLLNVDRKVESADAHG